MRINDEEVILGIEIANISKIQLLEIAKNTVEARNKVHIITLNTEMIVHFLNSNYLKIGNNGEKLVIAESSGLLVGSEFNVLARQDQSFKVLKLIIAGWKVAFQGATGRFKEKINGVDLSLSLAKQAEKNGWPIMLLGGADSVAKIAANKLREEFPKLVIKFSFGTTDPWKNAAAIINEVNTFKPRILLVAFGHGKQERWISAYLDKLDTSVAVGVGGALDFISGRVQRAPKWLQNLGLEWLFRLIIQPWRLRRQLVLFKFLYLLLKQKKNP